MPKVKNNTVRPIRTPSGKVLPPGQETEVTDKDMENRRLKKLMEDGELSHGNREGQQTSQPAPTTNAAPAATGATATNAPSSTTRISNPPAGKNA